MGHNYATPSYETHGKVVKTYAVGEKAVYLEGGVRFNVEVVNNALCNNAIERYTLRINEVVADNPMKRKICLQPETEFECQRLRSTRNRGLWALVSEAKRA
ncbi:MAG: hypothetical protein AABX91_02245 [Nanoarchaeota archaeon]